MPKDVRVRRHRRKRGFVGDIERLTEHNPNFRKVIHTARHSQLVLMSLEPGEDIGAETHRGIDQFFRVEAGKGLVEIDGVRHPIQAGDAVVVPSGSEHNVINTSKVQPLKLYTIYSPPEHKDKVVRRTKREAEAIPE
jgi:mannose-6-phosphate isomerase-like protein (cupin superfamily)